MQFLQTLKKSLKRDADSNKGNFGHVLIIGGDKGMGGAVIMAAEASYRAGAGKVSSLIRKENISPLLARLPNAMTIDEDSCAKEILNDKNVIVIGCGLGKSSWAKRLLKIALASDLPKVIDADALNIISENNIKADFTNSVITPHPGEAARLLGISVAEIQQDRKSAIKKLQKKFGAITVLKGSRSLILGKNGKINECSYGNPGMAVAGMGDVLSGLIGGFLAQGLDIEKSAIYGVNIHAKAGDLAAKEIGEISLIPNDLIEYIPKLLK